jgi:hypothetical protein
MDATLAAASFASVRQRALYSMRASVLRWVYRETGNLVMQMQCCMGK